MVSDDNKYKWIHVLNDSVGFNLLLIELLNEGNLVKNQLFITTNEELFGTVKQRFNNVNISLIRVNDKIDKTIYMINRFGDCSDYIVVHSFLGDVTVAAWHIKRKYLNKIIWRTWGHDVQRFRYVHYHSDVLLKNVILKVSGVCINGFRLIRRFGGIERVKRFKAVGVGNRAVDAVNIQETLGIQLKYFELPYPQKDSYEIVNKIRLLTNLDNICHVMVGHSGFPQERHMEILQLLKRFENKDIFIHVMLPYGDADYIASVKMYVEKNWREKCEIIDETTDFENYCRFMSRMSVIIIDATNSTALGTLSIALSLNKKLYVNKNGVLYKGLSMDNVECDITNNIVNQSFEEFKNMAHEYNWSSFTIQPYSQDIDKWKAFFEDIENEENRNTKGK